MIERNKLLTLNKAHKILVSNMVDKYRKHQRTGQNIASNFLNPYELQIVISYLNMCHIPYSVYEPCPFLEKKIIYFGNYDHFITFYQISSLDSQNISHSQLLGSLFAIGFQESTIGDIFVEDGVCYYVNLSKMNAYLEENLTFVGRHPVVLKKVETLNLLNKHLELFTILVSSMRVDNIISKIVSQSRNQVKQMILTKQIFLNYQELKKSDLLLKTNDILSIRRIGKFKIGVQKGTTKKENIILEIYQYI